MFDIIFQVSYVVGLITGSGIRAFYGMKHRQDRTAIFRKEGFAVGFLASLWGVAILLPFIYIFTSWLTFANYQLPVWSGFIGVLTFTGALWLLWRSHADLGENWSVAAEIKEDHRLITSGVFRYIRHPMYAAHWLWGIAQALLIHNWMAGLASLAILVPVYILRVTREEKVMLEHFGNEYSEYMSRTGRIIPRFWR